MNIKSAQYISHEGKVNTVKATIDEQEMFVPISEGNSHYAEIMRQVDAGELTIQEAD